MTLSIVSAGISALRELENAAMPTGRLSTPEPTMALTRLTVDDATLLPVDSESVAAATSGAVRLRLEKKQSVAFLLSAKNLFLAETEMLQGGKIIEEKLNSQNVQKMAVQLTSLIM